MAGVTNSWIGTTVLDQPLTCGTNSGSTNSTFSNCVVWLIVGLVIGSLSFEKKHDTRQS